MSNLLSTTSMMTPLDNAYQIPRLKKKSCQSVKLSFDISLVSLQPHSLSASEDIWCSPGRACTTNICTRHLTFNYPIHTTIKNIYESNLQASLVLVAFWCDVVPSLTFFNHLLTHLWLHKHQALDLESQRWSSEDDVSDKPSKTSSLDDGGGTNYGNFQHPFRCLDVDEKSISSSMKKNRSWSSDQTRCELLYRLWIAIGLTDRPEDKVDTLPGFNVVSTSKTECKWHGTNVQGW